MTDPTNRRVLGATGLVLLAAGVLAICVAAQVFGTARSNHPVFDATLVRWWNEGGWISFAVVVAIGVVAALIGQALVRGQLRRNDGLSRTPLISFRAGPNDRGETTLRSPALSHVMERDLTTIPDVHGARVGLFGHFPELELRAVLDVGDEADLEQVAARVDEALGRMATTTGIRPDPVQMTLRFRNAERQRGVA